jgi:hypothetical protein
MLLIIKMSVIKKNPDVIFMGDAIFQVPEIYNVFRRRPVAVRLASSGDNRRPAVSIDKQTKQVRKQTKRVRNQLRT